MKLPVARVVICWSRSDIQDNEGCFTAPILELFTCTYCHKQIYGLVIIYIYQHVTELKIIYKLVPSYMFRR
jgi:hypothetical protein